ncbi:class I SAM-dependent methyltransferase [Streptomyces sp. NPDC058620]
MDTRAARLRRPEGTILYEVDHPELPAVKAAFSATATHRGVSGGRCRST